MLIGLFKDSLIYFTRSYFVLGGWVYNKKNIVFAGIVFWWLARNMCISAKETSSYIAIVLRLLGGFPPPPPPQVYCSNKFV